MEDLCDIESRRISCQNDTPTFVLRLINGLKNELDHGVIQTYKQQPENAWHAIAYVNIHGAEPQADTFDAASRLAVVVSFLKNLPKSILKLPDSEIGMSKPGKRGAQRKPCLRQRHKEGSYLIMLCFFLYLFLTKQ